MSEAVDPAAAAPGGWRGRLSTLSLGPGFDRLWIGSAVSQIGSGVGTLALSLTGVLTLLQQSGSGIHWRFRVAS